MTSRTWTQLTAATLLALGFFLLAPSALGGRATWVSTFGISMRPMIHAGDLVIARPQSSYHLGDIVAYHSPTLGGTVVLHRIVAQGPQGFTTKGDNNHWTDPDHPQGPEILGALWLHIPQGGHVLKLFTDPVLAPALIAVAGVVAGLVGTQVRRRRGSHRAPRRTWAASKGRAEPWVKPRRAPGPEWAAGTALAAVVLALLTSTQPTMISTSRPAQVQETTALSYTSALFNSTVYSAAGIRTGDPVFLHLTSTIDTHLTATFGFDPGPISGTVTPVGRIRAANGWSRDQALRAPQPLTTATAEADAPLDFAALLHTAHAAERQAGSSFGSFTVQVIYRIRATGTRQRRPITITSAPAMAFTLTDDQAVIQASATPSEPGAPLTSSSTTAVLVPITRPATVALLRWDVPITDVRALSAALFLLALVLGAWAARGPAASPQTTLGHRLVRAHNIDLAGRTVVDVDTVDVLAKLCDLYSTVALHASTDSHDLFVVIADQTVYRLATMIAAKGAPSQATDQPRPGQPAVRR